MPSPLTFCLSGEGTRGTPSAEKARREYRGKCGGRARLPTEDTMLTRACAFFCRSMNEFSHFFCFFFVLPFRRAVLQSPPKKPLSEWFGMRAGRFVRIGERAVFPATRAAFEQEARDALETVRPGRRGVKTLYEILDEYLDLKQERKDRLERRARFK